MRPGDSLSLVLIWPLLQFWREILCRVFVLPPEWTPCWLTSEYKHTGCFIITGRETFKTIKDIVNRQFYISHPLSCLLYLYCTSLTHSLKGNILDLRSNCLPCLKKNTTVQLNEISRIPGSRISKTGRVRSVMMCVMLVLSDCYSNRDVISPHD